MSRILNAGGLLAILAVGGWFVLKKFDIQGLEQIKLSPKTGQASNSHDPGVGGRPATASSLRTP